MKQPSLLNQRRAALPKEESDQEMSFFEHLEELRWHIIRGLAAILVATIAAFLAKSFVFDTLIFGPLSDQFFTYRALCRLSELLHLGDTICMKPTPFTISNFEMASQFTLHIQVSVLAGFIVSFPYILWELWRFLRPALHPHERRYAEGLVFYASLLFFVGILFGYYIMSPFSINFLATYSVSDKVSNLIGLSSYISLLSTVVLSSGIMFELPMLVYLLSKAGILSPDIMREYRRHAVVIILMISAIITPPDVMSQILVFIPVYVLYEVSIFISARIAAERMRQEALEEEEFRRLQQ
ncbi:MAG: twin-arginine translocase subunit TatC [Sphingobacteriales bacterium]|nr:twin-arginine translocase subunit TatC [Sphingobacteriales bacterium]